MLPTKMHMAGGKAQDLKLGHMFAWRSWKRATLCGKYIRLELTTEDWKKVDCKMCLKVKAANQ